MRAVAERVRTLPGVDDVRYGEEWVQKLAAIRAVATAAGVMLALTPASLGVAALVWAVLVYATGYVSLGSIAAAAVFPVAVYLLERPDRPEILWVDVLVAAGIIWLHRANIKRLLHGTENRFGRRAAPPAHP